MVSGAAINGRALALGFDRCGIAPATALPELSRLARWLDKGYAGEMRYLDTSAATRADIREFLPSAQAVIVTATNYHVGAAATSPPIARYAWGDDYHRVLAGRLEQLVAWMREAAATPFEWRIFVDKHHVQERVFAKHAGLGWIGKNTMLIDPELGSYTFLAGVAVSLAISPDDPIDDRCGSCTICIDACPTGALVDEYELDARRCISYLTIEHKGTIPGPQRVQLGDHIYGCDVCQEVCPYNLAPLASLDPAWQPKAGRSDASAVELWERSDHELHALVNESAMTRVSLSRLRRNLAIVLGNSGDARAARALDRPGNGVRHAAQSAETELVHDHVRWAKDALGVR